MVDSKKNVSHKAKEKVFPKLKYKLSSKKKLIPRQQFYLRGFEDYDMKDTKTHRHFKKVVKDVHDWKIKDGFVLEKKTKFPAYDLKEDPFLYDDCFLDILFDQKIPQKLYELTGEVLHLQSIKVRIGMPGKNSYLLPHRDTIFRDNAIVGLFPPLVNLAYYPNFDNETEPELNFWPTSQITIYRHRILDKFKKYFVKPVHVYKHNDKFTLFDTSAFHSVNPTKNPKGSIRVMYSFCREFQTQSLASSQKFKPHQEEYWRRVKKLDFHKLK